MGYTHYWDRPEVMPKRKFVEWSGDVALILAATAGRVALAGGYGTGKPEITADRVWLNGPEATGEDYETFGVDRVHPEPFPDTPYARYVDGRKPSRSRKVSDFCKTARMPYDLVVCAALIRLAVRFPACDVSSDGGSADWGPALELCESAFGTGHDFPRGVARDTCKRCGELAVRSGHVGGAWRNLCRPCWDRLSADPAIAI